MSIENLLAEIIDEYDQEKIDTLFSDISDEWIYFFFFETNDKDTPPGKGNVTQIIYVDIDYPINIPMIENSEGCYGVIYTNRELAISFAEFQCKIGKLKGINAFELFLDIEKLDGVYIQGEAGNILPKREYLENYVANYA